ncbi:hypothetical protein J7E38_16220 [Bacillus sp. ISL-35]|uniref:hypothetical protein n=1 Tax=Bacillus sp. ISL-35 TaxID=2819122 RepID=UPI001BEA36FA|nr:hypothetical protein [Bacillus sp. ISL-35]MBT2680556.1 hypothetical protein [Bacillus sp. ISL-35]MBT2704150.1 hypothetical protein [Chryseobacterium sp. ISL-80]
MEERKFYTSRIYMFVSFIVSVPLFIMMGWIIYSGLDYEKDWLYWAGLILSLLFEMLFLHMVVYSLKQLINPKLLITVTETGVIVFQDKRNVEIGWGDIESYMICRNPGSGNVVYFYIFVKDGVISPTIPKQIKVEFHFMKNQQKLKAIFKEKNIKELPPDYELVKHMK